MCHKPGRRVKHINIHQVLKTVPVSTQLACFPFISSSVFTAGQTGCQTQEEGLPQPADLETQLPSAPVQTFVLPDRAPSMLLATSFLDSQVCKGNLNYFLFILFLPVKQRRPRPASGDHGHGPGPPLLPRAHRHYTAAIHLVCNKVSLILS